MGVARRMKCASGMSTNRLLAIALLMFAVGCQGAKADSSAQAAPTADTATAQNGAAPGYVREVHRATQLEFDIPASWQKQVQGDVMVLTSPAGAALELVAASGEQQAKSDEKAMLTAVERTLKNPKFTSGLKPVQQHGLTGFAATGKGQKNGGEVEWFTLVIGDGHGHAILGLGFYRPDTPQDVKNQMMHTLDSIQPAR
jgi:hypothetical protein